MSRELDPFITSEYSYNCHDLLLKLKRRGPPRHRDHSKRMIIEKLNEDADCEIATTALCISLMCPLARKRMKYPCRARTCAHLQCFDTLFYLQMNECKPTWNCPVCDKPAPYDDLYIDGYFLEVLYSPLIGSETVEIQLHKDGSWSTRNEINRVVPLDDCIEIFSDDSKLKTIVVETVSPPVILKDEDRGDKKLNVESDTSRESSSSDGSSTDSSSSSSTVTSTSASSRSLASLLQKGKKDPATWRPFETPDSPSASSIAANSLKPEATYRPFEYPASWLPTSWRPFETPSYGANSLTPFEATWGLHVQEAARRALEGRPEEKGVVDLTLMEDDEALSNESRGEAPPLSLRHFDALKYVNVGINQGQQAGVVDLTLLNDDEPQRNSTVDLTIESSGIEANPEVAKEKCVVDLTELNDDESPAKRRRLTQTVDLTSDTTSILSGSHQSWKLSIPGFDVEKSAGRNVKEDDEIPTLSKQDGDSQPKEFETLCVRETGDKISKVEAVSPTVNENDVTLLSYIRDELRLELTSLPSAPINTRAWEAPVREDEATRQIQPDLTLGSSGLSDPFWMSCDPWREYVGGHPRAASAMDCSCGPKHQPETEGDIRASMFSYLFFR